MTSPKALYVHVPFCRTICYYCDFCHVIYDEHRAQAYLKALKKEIDGTVRNHRLDTIYLGGGTPTSLNEAQLEQLLSLFDSFSHYVKEYTIEINPETVNDEKIALLKKHGVNRVSIGVQSTVNQELKLMNRHHDFSLVQQCIDKLMQEGIENISVDLLYSLPFQTMASLQETVSKTLTLPIKHISIYALTIEPHTVFQKKGYQPLEGDMEADMYEWLIQTFENHGFHQYEISNFAKDKYESKHNLVYWHYEDFYGIGPGASGKSGNRRYDHSRNIQEYIENPLTVKNISLTKEESEFEFVMMGFRLKKGIEKQRFLKCYGETVNQRFSKAIHITEEQGLINENEEYVYCTKKGYPILNTVLEYFL